MAHSILAVDVRPQARAWLLLATGALAVSTLLALLLVLSRAPTLGALLPGAQWFRPALVLHVNLAVTVWFLAFAAALWSGTQTAPRAAPGLAPGWAAFAVSACGAAALLAAPALAPGPALLSSYVPVLDSALFLAGLAWFACGVAATFALRFGRRTDAQDEQRVPLALTGVPVVTALLSAAWSAMLLPQGPRAVYFESLFWSAGRTLQLAYVCLMMLAWLELARSEGVLVSQRAAALCFAVQAAPALAVPALHALYPVDGPAFREACTLLMRWGAWPGALLLAAFLLKAGWRRESLDRAARTGWRISVLLFLVGLLLGAMIRGDDLLVSAHYHATVGAVTAALMGLALRMLPRLGWRASDARAAVAQARLYGGGLLVLALSLAWAGWHGVPRRSPVLTHPLAEPAQLVGMAVAGVGGALAVAGATLFFVLVARAILPDVSHRLTRWTAGVAWRRDRRAFAVALTASLVLAGGALIALLPGQGESPRSHRDDPELRVRFQAAVTLLAAGQHEQAAIALHRVLMLAPELPEAHTNMGYAMLGLQRFEDARRFFESASALRPEQANAYYGLAVALEHLSDLPGALGAMRTYVHLAQASDPHVPKARAALWEWEAELQARAAAPTRFKPGPGHRGKP